MNAAPPPHDDVPGSPAGAPGGAPGATTTGPGGPGGPGDQRGPRVTPEDMRDLGRMRRSTTDRKIAGVAGGIARHLDIDPLVVRVALVVLSFFGGGGLLLYAAGWLLLPEDDGTPAPIRLDDRSRNVALAIAGALAVLALVGDSFGGWHFPWPLAVVAVVVVALLSRRDGRGRPPRGWVDPEHPGAPYGGYPGATSPTGAPPEPTRVEASAATDTPAPHAPHAPHGRPGCSRPRDPRRRGPLLFGYTLVLAALAAGALGTLQLAGYDVPVSAYPAAVLAACGLMLLVGAFYGRGGGLILVGLLAAGATAVATVGDPVSAGEIRETPTTAAQLEDGYELTMGTIELDLTEITDLDALGGETVDIDLRMGHVAVVVPEEGLDVEVVAEIDGAGETKLFGDSRDGSDTASHDGGDDVPVLRFETDMLFGQIEFETQESAA